MTSTASSRRRAGGQLGGAREQRRPARTASSRARVRRRRGRPCPRRPTRSSVFSIQRSLSRRAPGPRLPPDAARGRRDGAVSSVAPVRPASAVASGRADLVDDDVDGGRLEVGHATRGSRAHGAGRRVRGPESRRPSPARGGARPRVGRPRRRRATPRCRCRWLSTRPRTPRNLAGGVGRVLREDVARDRGARPPSTPILGRSSVASGRAKKRNGTKVVPRPGETCSVSGRAAVEPARVREARVREAELAARMARRSGRRACGRRARGGTRPAGAGRRCAGSGRAGCAGRRPGRRARSARLAAQPSGVTRVEADDLDAPAAQLDRRPPRRESSVAGRAS